MSVEGPRKQNRLGESLMATRPLEAIGHFARAIELGYSQPDCFRNMARLLREINRFEDALAISLHGLQVCGEAPVLLNSKGLALWRLGYYEEALATFQRQAALVKPQQRPWGNLGIALVSLGRLEEAKQHFRKVIEFNAKDRDARRNLAITLLLEGRYEEGFREYEMRPPTGDRRFEQPSWRGEPLRNKRILLTAEQGAGDVIQFARYAPLVRERGGRVILEIPKTLERLFSWNLERFETVIEREHQTTFDVQCPLLSLPYRCETGKDSIPPAQSVRVPEEMRRRWGAILGETHAPRVALVWAGTPKHENDINRSIPLSALAPLLDHEGIRWFSLQVGPAASQIASYGWRNRILDLSPLLTDYAETAGALSKMDLLITVDTSVTHLAGTLQMPVWTLLPFAPDWRWLLHREDSPWYPSMRLFRQSRPRDWRNVVALVEKELAGRFPVGTSRSGDSYLQPVIGHSE